MESVGRRYVESKKRFMPPSMVSFDKVQAKGGRNKEYSKSIVTSQAKHIAESAISFENPKHAQSRILLDNDYLQKRRIRNNKRTVHQSRDFGGDSEVSLLNGGQSQMTHVLSSKILPTEVIASPVREYRAKDAKTKHAGVKLKDFVTQSLDSDRNLPQKPLRMNNLKNHAGNVGVLDRIRMSQFKAEQRDMRLKKNIVAKNLLPDDGDHGVGVWKRRPLF